MRLLQLSVTNDEREAVVDILAEYDLGYTIAAGAGDQEDRSQVGVLVPADAVEHLLDDLRAAGVEETQFTVSVNAEFASFEGIDGVQNTWQDTPNRIAPQALRSKAKSMRPNWRAYLWMMVLSTVVATSGLLLGSPAIVVGSMVIAPIVGPMLTASIGAVRDDQAMLVESIHMQGVGLGVAVVGATLYGLLIQQLELIPATLAVTSVELVSIRMAPGLLSLAVGLAAGAAGAFGLATKGQVSLVGVMIAAALIPTAAAAGIAVAWGNIVVAVGALLLLVLSLVAVNTGVLLVLVYLGYRPDNVDQGILDFASGREAAIVLATLAVVVLVAAVVAFGTVSQTVFERETNKAVTGTLDDEQYRGLSVTTISTEYITPWSLDDQPTVTVTLTRTGNRSYPDLPRTLDGRISERTGRDVIVSVRYTDYNRSLNTAHGRSGR